jgi:hypothetical protein
MNKYVFCKTFLLVTTVISLGLVPAFALAADAAHDAHQSVAPADGAASQDAHRGCRL